MKYFLLLFVAFGLGFVLWVRFSRDDTIRWHLDPLVTVLSGKPNQFLLEAKNAPVFDVKAKVLAETFDKVALARPNVRLLAGSIDDLWLTYVQRSALMRYPDYISVRFLDRPDGTATLAVFSRSRFGYSDLGVNQKRVNAWVVALEQAIVAR